MSIQSFEDNDKYFIKFFLLDATINLNEWGVTEPSLLANLDTFLGKPFVITPEFGHPTASSGDELLTVQNNFKVGTIIEVGLDKLEKKAFGIAEITDELAKELLRSGKVNFVSPSIVFNGFDVDQRYDGSTIVNKFEGAHVAGVKDPAYGMLKAQIKGKCAGDKASCTQELAMVQASKKDRILTFEYENKTMMLKASSCVQECIQKKSDEGKVVDEQALAICYSECGESRSAEFVEDEHPRDDIGQFTDKGGGEDIKNDVSVDKSLKSRGIKGEELENQKDKINELVDNEAHVNNDGTVRVYHHTSEENKTTILDTGKMKGKEDGIFFTTKKNSDTAEGFGKSVIVLDIPIELLQIDDEFGDEAHLRIPTSKIGSSIDISKFKAKNAMTEKKCGEPPLTPCLDEENATIKGEKSTLELMTEINKADEMTDEEKKKKKYEEEMMAKNSAKESADTVEALKAEVEKLRKDAELSKKSPLVKQITDAKTKMNLGNATEIEDFGKKIIELPDAVLSAMSIDYESMASKTASPKYPFETRYASVEQKKELDIDNFREMTT